MDAISHKILLDKLHLAGFSEGTVNWYETYSAEHHFALQVANWVSNLAIMSSDISQ